MAHSTENAVTDALRSTAPSREPLGDKQEVCNLHGAFISSGVRYLGRREIWTACPECAEIETANARRADAQQQADKARARMESAIENSAIPLRFVGRTFENFRASTTAQDAALTILQNYAEEFEQHLKRGTGLILSGLPGTGKSHLAGAVLQAIMPERCGLYTTCMNVIRSVRGTWRKDSERSENAVLNAYAQTPLLVLDEVGVQYGTDGEQTILFDVLDRRYREMMPTIFLTNQAKDGFKQFIGERVYDRLTETCRWVSFDWQSYRPQAKKEAV